MNTYKKSGFAKKSFGARGSAGRPAGRPFERRAPHGAAAGTERFQATCAHCGATCEVPFKPNGKKPVYCRDCFKGQEDASKGEHRSASSAASSDLSRQFELLNLKLDKLIKAVEGHQRG